MINFKINGTSVTNLQHIKGNQKVIQVTGSHAKNILIVLKPWRRSMIARESASTAAIIHTIRYGAWPNIERTQMGGWGALFGLTEVGAGIEIKATKHNEIIIINKLSKFFCF